MESNFTAQNMSTKNGMINDTSSRQDTIIDQLNYFQSLLSKRLEISSDQYKLTLFNISHWKQNLRENSFLSEYFQTKQ